MDASRLIALSDDETHAGRRQQGVRDGRAGKPRSLNDETYVEGYALGRDQRQAQPTDLLPTGTPSVSSFHGA